MGISEYAGLFDPLVGIFVEVRIVLSFVIEFSFYVVSIVIPSTVRYFALNIIFMFSWGYQELERQTKLNVFFPFMKTLPINKTGLAFYSSF